MKKLHSICKDGRWGFVDYSGQVVIPTIWKHVFPFMNGVALVEDDSGYWGGIDEQGNLVFESRFLRIGNEQGSNSPICAIDESGLWGFFDYNGKEVLKPRWKAIRPFKRGLAAVQNTDGKWGFIDIDGQEVIPCLWKNARSFSEGLAAVQDDNKKWGFIEKNGKVAIQCTWEGAFRFSDELALVLNTNSEWGYIDKEGNIKIPCQFMAKPSKEANLLGFLLTTNYRRYEFKEGLACIRNQKGFVGYIDKQGELTIPYSWKDAKPFSEGRAKVQLMNGKWGYIDTEGNLVLSCIYEECENFMDGCAWVKTENIWRLINKRGHFLNAEGKTYYYEVCGDIVHPDDGDICYEDAKLFIPFLDQELSEITTVIAEAEKEGCGIWEIMQEHISLQTRIESELPYPYASFRFQVYSINLNSKIFDDEATNYK